MTEPSIKREFEERAINGDGQFAIAYAILLLVEGVDRIGFNGLGDPGSGPGCLEYIGMCLSDIKGALADLGVAVQ